MIKICFFTATRAEYGLLKPLIKSMQKTPDFKIQIIVSGTHLSPEYGMTQNEIVSDKIPINRRVEILLSSDTQIGVAKSMGLAIPGIAEALTQLKPDLMVILGDRYEALAAASAAIICNVPIAHIHGGEITEGAIDDSMRHAITKLATIHFTSTDKYRQRVIQMGEAPEMVFNVGALGIDNIRQTQLIAKAALFKELKIKSILPHLLITYHPVTKQYGEGIIQIEELLKGLSNIKNMVFIFTASNSDAEGRIINEKIKAYVEKKENSYLFTSLGQVRYLSMMSTASIVVGNSSSGIIEAPSFGVPTINIGDRQKGRIKAKSNIDCHLNSVEIQKACKHALSQTFKKICNKKENPYGDGFTTKRIIKILLNKKGNFVKSPFYEA